MKYLMFGIYQASCKSNDGLTNIYINIFIYLIIIKIYL